MKPHFKLARVFTLVLLPFILVSQALAGGSASDPEVVPNVDLQKYAGFWYEIAHKPNFFQIGCLKSTAEYQVLSPISVSVHNTCYKENNQTSDIRGKATVVDPQVPAKLEVQFNAFAKGEYWIIDMDPNYQWAVVSASKKKSLFILSRQAPMAPDLLDSILRRLQSKGFQLDDLIYDQYP